jgi:hypothetical protein
VSTSATCWAGTREGCPRRSGRPFLEAAFDLERALAHVDEPFVRVRERLGLEREAAGAR